MITCINDSESCRVMFHPHRPLCAQSCVGRVLRARRDEQQLTARTSPQAWSKPAQADFLASMGLTHLEPSQIILKLNPLLRIPGHSKETRFSPYDKMTFKSGGYLASYSKFWLYYRQRRCLKYISTPVIEVTSFIHWFLVICYYVVASCRTIPLVWTCPSVCLPRLKGLARKAYLGFSMSSMVSERRL